MRGYPHFLSRSGRSARAGFEDESAAIEAHPLDDDARAQRGIERAPHDDGRITGRLKTGGDRALVLYKRRCGYELAKVNDVEPCRPRVGARLHVDVERSAGRALQDGEDVDRLEIVDPVPGDAPGQARIGP